MRIRSVLWLAVASFALPAFANPTPFHYSVDDFGSPERGFSDNFNGTAIGPQWTAFGTVSEGGGVATFSNPGLPGFLAPFPLDSDTSGINGFGTPLNGAGSFRTLSTWLRQVPDPGTSYSFALGSVDGQNNTHQIALSVTNTDPQVAPVLSTNPGLNVDMILQIRDANFVITSWQVTSQPFRASDVTGPVVLTLVYDDQLKDIVPVYSLDGGTTSHVFNPVAWNFPGGNFALVSSATRPVPEPSTAALLAFGLAAFGASRRRR